jgi:hypothetical protein
LNSPGPDEAALFADAVHPTHAARPVGCWAPRKEKLAIEQTSGRQRINIHGAIDLETGQTRMIEVETVDALSTIKLLEAIEAMYPMLYDFRTMVERINGRLKDEFGDSFVRVREAVKVKCHLMFGILALTVDQIFRVGLFTPTPA